MPKGSKKVSKVARKPKSNKPLYFSPETQNAIERYQISTVDRDRHQIYTREIFPAFDKLVENLIFMYGFAKTHDSYESLKNDCVSFLYEQIHKFNPRLGKKAFSYFNVVARNWLIIRTKQRLKSIRRHVSIDDQASMNATFRSMVENHQVIPSQDEILIARGRKDEIKGLLSEMRTRLTNDNEIACMDAIIDLFEKIDDLEFLNKRALFVYIREVSNLNPKQVSTAMSAIRRHYKEVSQEPDFRLF